MSNMNNYDEIPKYRKKQKSGVSKSKEKSKHKHNYVECFIKYDMDVLGKNRTFTGLRSYCDICGKIGGTLDNGKIRNQYHDTKVTHNNRTFISPWTNKIEEIYEKHKDEVPTFYLNDFMDKYVVINKEVE